MFINYIETKKAVTPNLIITEIKKNNVYTEKFNSGRDSIKIIN